MHILPSASDITTASARTAAQSQPKVSKALILVEEYHYQVTIPLPSARLPSVDDKNCLLTGAGPAPPGSRVLRVNFDGGILFPKRPRPGFDFLSQVAQSTSGKVVSITCGVYRTPMQFARQAISLQHPFDMCRALPDPALEVLARTLIDGPVVVAKSRLKTILKWKQWKRELEAQEAALHKAMHPDVARVMEGKNLLLLQKIADSLEWPDANLHHDLVQGFRLIGDEQPSGIFPVEPKPALASIEEFWERALLVKHALWQKVADSPADRFSQGLYEVTENEREKGVREDPVHGGPNHGAGIIRRWSDTGKKHLIGPVELYAVVCARRVWGSFLNHARVLIFVDHSGVHAACVSGASKDPVWRSLLIELECADADAMMGWIARVPSPSNPADAPSAGA